MGRACEGPPELAAAADFADPDVHRFVRLFDVGALAEN